MDIYLGRLDSTEVAFNQADRQVLKVNPKSICSVSSGVAFLDNYEMLQIPWKDIWHASVPHKIQFFMWTSLGKISTIDVLRKKGMILTNMCSLCKGDGELLS